MTIIAIFVAIFFTIMYGPSESVVIALTIILAFIGIFIAFTEWDFSSGSNTKPNLEADFAELEIKQRELEDKMQSERLETEIQSEKKQLELKAQREALELVRFRLDMMQKRLDLQEQSLNYSFRATYQIIETLSPKMDQETRKLLIQDVLPRILQLQSSSNVESVDAKEEFDDGKI